jgi:hypothetical protein
MANGNDGREAHAVEAAYDEHVAALFKMLITNLGDKPVSRETDRQCVEKFRKGINVAKRARQLALDALQPAVG